MCDVSRTNIEKGTPKADIECRAAPRSKAKPSRYRQGQRRPVIPIKVFRLVVAALLHPEFLTVPKGHSQQPMSLRAGKIGRNGKGTNVPNEGRQSKRQGHSRVGDARQKKEYHVEI
jgi:hypothetical protein